MSDRRLALTYSYREKPYGIPAKISEDNAQTRGNEIVLHDNAGRWDLGYPRTVQRRDGKIVTSYYQNDHRHSKRFIAKTIKNPQKTTEFQRKITMINLQ